MNTFAMIYEVVKKFQRDSACLKTRLVFDVQNGYSKFTFRARCFVVVSWMYSALKEILEYKKKRGDSIGADCHM